MNFWQQWKPAASKPWLILTAGLIWGGVGLMLARYTFIWLRPIPLWQASLLAALGAGIAFTGYRFMFRKSVQKNIRRIEAYALSKICLFAFQRWQSYPLVAVMIAGGIFLRKHSGIPKPALSVLYLGMGGSLFVASFHYFAWLWSAWQGRDLPAPLPTGED